MTIQVEAKRVKFGQALTDYENQIDGACAQLEGIKVNLLNMKTAVENDIDFTVDDAAEVQTVIDNAVIRIQQIIS